MLGKPSRERLVGQAVEALRKALSDRLVAVVLFGSRARGDASPDSDWDLLVIAEGLPEGPMDRHIFLKRLLPPDCRGAVSLLAKTPEEFQANVPPLYLDVALDGEVPYDRLGYATERLGALRRMLKELGLYRERTDAGDLWMWRKEPVAPWALRWER